MSKQITLPSGNTAVIRDVKSLLMKDRNKVLEAANKEEGVLQATAMQDGLISIMVTDWSFDLIPPNVRISSLGELTPKDYEALWVEASKAQEYLFPTLQETDEGLADPKASTANSNA